HRVPFQPGEGSGVVEHPVEDVEAWVRRELLVHSVRFLWRRVGSKEAGWPAPAAPATAYRGSCRRRPPLELSVRHAREVAVTAAGDLVLGLHGKLDRAAVGLPVALDELAVLGLPLEDPDRGPGLAIRREVHRRAEAGGPALLGLDPLVHALPRDRPGL